MAQFQQKDRGFGGKKRPVSSNVKSKQKYERFGETIRYLTFPEWQRFLECVEVYEHKLMMRMIYELGCRVGEFVRVRLGDIDLTESREEYLGFWFLCFTEVGWHKCRGMVLVIAESFQEIGEAVPGASVTAST